MLITHNLGLVARYAQRAVVMQNGKVVEAGTTEQVLTTPREAYTRQLIDALPRRATDIARLRTGEPLMSVRGLKVEFAGRRQFFRQQPGLRAVDGIDLDIRAGETVAVVGGSGSGKTTLGRAMLRLIPSAAGQIRFRGKEVPEAADGTFGSHRNSCFRIPTRRSIRACGSARSSPNRCGMSPNSATTERTKRVEKMLDEVGLAGFAKRWPHELSGGQRQRIAIARAIVRGPLFVVADEPVSALDMTIQAQVLKLLSACRRNTASPACSSAMTSPRSSRSPIAWW